MRHNRPATIPRNATTTDSMKFLSQSAPTYRSPPQVCLRYERQERLFPIRQHWWKRQFVVEVLKHRPVCVYFDIFRPTRGLLVVSKSWGGGHDFEVSRRIFKAFMPLRDGFRRIRHMHDDNPPRPSAETNPRSLCQTKCLTSLSRPRGQLWQGLRKP